MFALHSVLGVCRCCNLNADIAMSFFNGVRGVIAKSEDNYIALVCLAIFVHLSAFRSSRFNVLVSMLFGTVLLVSLASLALSCRLLYPSSHYYDCGELDAVTTIASTTGPPIAR